MENNFAIIEKLNSFFYLMCKNSARSKRDYNIGIPLHRSEIHTLECIENHKECNASTLSKILGITNGALNQMTTKLIQKGLVEQYQHPVNHKEVFYKLTLLGKTANEEHAKHHAAIYSNIISYIEQLDPGQQTAIDDFLDYIITSIRDDCWINETQI
ncbi:MarR family winged helix-turn-helix transcriptional regulator [Anaeromicropila populeti]|uniref:DNA-binding transcriptional regulator, MarR family n=1 Tax=Anaeromicropila populeti TaxID=37658 RepID=A0A1I6HNH4_9FIRM|nr:MarR family winged helix-turn-helix transcriptional regulator [Anaeromicropila populeti]SFR56029.1 DNA-binding transcriptional regulator, MarR family [Anaeromicropila populeti]